MKPYIDDLFWVAGIALLITPLALQLVKIPKKMNLKPARIYCGTVAVLISLYFFAQTIGASLNRTTKDINLMALGSLGLLLIGISIIIFPVGKRK